MEGEEAGWCNNDDGFNDEIQKNTQTRQHGLAEARSSDAGTTSRQHRRAMAKYSHSGSN